MNKKTVLNILLDSIFIIVFNIVFFVLGDGEHPASVWISFGFILFSYIMVIITPFITRKCTNATIFSLPDYLFSSTYFFVEFVVGLIFIFIRSESFEIPLIIQIILAAIYAVILISNALANENSADAIEASENEVAYIKSIASRVKLLIGKASETQANKEIERVYDLLSTSPTHSNELVKNIEDYIRNRVIVLEDAVASDESTVIIMVAEEIIDLVEDRNSRLKNTN